MNYLIEMQPLAGRYVVALKDPGTGDTVKVLSVNSSAAEMLRLRLEGHDVPSIAGILSERFGVSALQVSTDAENLFRKLELLGSVNVS